MVYVITYKLRNREGEDKMGNNDAEHHQENKLKSIVEIEILIGITDIAEDFLIGILAVIEAGKEEPD